MLSQRCRSPRRFLQPAAAAALAGIILLTASCARDEPAGSGPHRVVPSVEAVPARHGTLPLTQRLSGEIQAALARAVIGGLTVSILITLVVIPAAYSGLHDLLRRLRP